MSEHTWGLERVAAAAGARIARRARAEGRGPGRAVVDSREVRAGDLFVGVPGRSVDGGAFATQALQAGAWAALVTLERAPVAAAEADAVGATGAVLGAPDPVAALGRLARAWRRARALRVIAITGSTGKTSTKDILAALLGSAQPTYASRANLNTEIGLPLAILEAPPASELLVLELAMRGTGQIAELTEIAEPDVGVIVNVGPVHLELLGSLEAIATAKAELLGGLRPGTTAVLPVDEPLLAPYGRADLDTITFGETGDVRLVRQDGPRVELLARGERVALEVPFTQMHHRRNLLPAVAAAVAVGVHPAGRVDVVFSAHRGERVRLGRGITVIDDCYNANPVSVRAALDDLAGCASGPDEPPGRLVAVLGDMLELGPDELAFHAEVGRYAASRGVSLLVAVGSRAVAVAESFAGEAHRVADADAAARLVGRLLAPGDTVLVKGSRAVGLERVVDALRVSAGEPADSASAASAGEPVDSAPAASAGEPVHRAPAASAGEPVHRAPAPCPAAPLARAGGR